MDYTVRLNNTFDDSFKFLNELNLVSMSRLDPDIATTVDHHEPEIISSILLCLSLHLRKTVATRRKTEIFLAR